MARTRATRVRPLLACGAPQRSCLAGGSAGCWGGARAALEASRGMMRRRRAGALQLGGALLLAAAAAADANGAEDASGHGSTNHYEVIGTQVAVPLEGLEAAVYEKERSDKHEDIRDAVSGGAQVEWASTAAAAEDDVESRGGVEAKGVATTSENGQGGSEGGDVLEETACRWLGFVHIPKTGGTSVMQAINRSPVARSRAVYFARLNHVVAEGQRSLVKQRRAEKASSGRTASWDDSRTVTFASVRNPFAWAVSQYEFGKQAHCKSAANSSRDMAHRYPVCAIADDAEGSTPANATETTGPPPGHGAQNHGPPSLRQKQLRDHFAEWLREHDQLANSTKHEGFMAPNLIGLRSLKEKWCGREGDSGNAHHGTSQLRWLTTCDEEHWAVKVRSLACMFFLTDPAGKQAASRARS